MKTNIKACRFFSIFLSIILFFNLFVLNIFTKNKALFGLFLIIYWLNFRLFVKPKESKTEAKKFVLIWSIVLAVIFLIIWYIMGMLSDVKISDGFYSNPIKYILNPMWLQMFPHVMIIIYSELMRTLVIVQKDKKSTMWITMAMILIDIVININIYHYSSIEGILEILGCLILSSISLNLLFNYISKRYGSLPNTIFKLITVIMYNYYMPILPDIYPIFETIIKLIFPFIIYLIIDYLFEPKQREINDLKDRSLIK